MRVARVATSPAETAASVTEREGAGKGCRPTSLVMLARKSVIRRATRRCQTPLPFQAAEGLSSGPGLFALPARSSRG